MVAEAVARFPATFGLRAFPGKVFRLSAAESYVSDLNGLMLYTLVQRPDGTWAAFAKGTEDELRKEVVP